jgi:hypothetical protein
MLVGAVYIQYGATGAEESPPMVATAPRPRLTPRQTSQSPSPPSDSEQPPEDTPERQLSPAFDQTRWKSPELATVTAYDPFALPAAFPQPAPAAADPLAAQHGSPDPSAARADANQLAAAVEQLRTALEELQQRGVHVIVRERNQYVAMIGDRLIHVGDEINGFTVTAIEPDGVRVERKVLE